MAKRRKKTIKRRKTLKKTGGTVKTQITRAIKSLQVIKKHV